MELSDIKYEINVQYVLKGKMEFKIWVKSKTIHDHIWKKQIKLQEIKIIIIMWNSVVEFKSKLDIIEERMNEPKHKTSVTYNLILEEWFVNRS